MDVVHPAFNKICISFLGYSYSSLPRLQVNWTLVATLEPYAAGKPASNSLAIKIYFGHIHHINVRCYEFFGHIHKFRSYSFGHLESVKWVFLLSGQDTNLYKTTNEIPHTNPKNKITFLSRGSINRTKPQNTSHPTRLGRFWLHEVKKLVIFNRNTHSYQDVLHKPIYLLINSNRWIHCLTRKITNSFFCFLMLLTATVDLNSF